MRFRREVKVGLFAVGALALIVWATIRVGDQSIISRGAYELIATFRNASGLYPKASIEVAGVKVGLVKEVGLTREGLAKVVMGIQKDVRVTENSKAFLRSRGFLGEAYIEIIPGNPELPALKSGATMTQTESGGDISDMVDRFNSISGDVKEVSGTMREWVGHGEEGHIRHSVERLDEFVTVMRNLTVSNEKSLNNIIRNMADLTTELKDLIRESRGDVTDSTSRIASITQKIDEGRGSIGRLVNDGSTVEKLNDSLDNLNDALGGFRSMELGLGFHTEYLNRGKDFKNYVSLEVKPTPSESVLIDLVSDPSPDTSRERRISDITVGGATTKVTTENEILSRDRTLFSAQLAKKFYDFRIRGGIIESKGGIGLDYIPGFVNLHAEGFDFENDFNEKPHLKFMGTLNLTQNLYLLGGMDDPLNPAQKTDYFFGGGFRFVDENIKSLFSLARVKP